MTNVTIAGETYNLGAVTGDKGNVGGIVGAIDDTGGTTSNKIQNVANHGNVLAKDSIKTEIYEYHKYKNNAWQNDNENKIAYVANAGGIAGKVTGASNGSRATIENVQNDGDVKTSAGEEKYEYTDDEGKKDGELPRYNAGNVGGIVGSAQYADIINAENMENHVAGAHNVGGIAGYLRDGKVSDSINDGGDITATGAWNGTDIVKETVRDEAASTEEVIVGNIGGVVGYLYGNNACIENAANRGTVHSTYIPDNATATPEVSKAANVGGVVGKVSMMSQPGNNTSTSNVLSGLKNGSFNATITNSYNTGDVLGYTGVGGVAGQMVRGSITESYNLGDVTTTRISRLATTDPVNMGGVVGDTSVSDAGDGTVIYDVYNAGKIGDETYQYYGRHVGGVVGRLGGTLEKAYNTGEIYNGYSVTGGVVGYWYSGNIKNVFNTGNVTVKNHDIHARNSLVGGIVGAATTEVSKTLSYAYNLGTLRSFIPDSASSNPDNQEITPDDNINVVGGIIGGVTETENGTITINNVYSTGNIYAGRENKDGEYVESKDGNNPDRVGAIYGMGYTGDPKKVNLDINTSYFIEPDTEGGATYTTPTDNNGLSLDNGHIIAWKDRMDSSKYAGFNPNTDGVKTNGEASDYEDGWRMYDGKNGMETLPMLNAFTPNTAKNEGKWKNDDVSGKIESVQYGTAANPLLTIINLNNQGVKDGISLNWENLGLSGAGSLAVYGGGNLTLTDFCSDTGRYYNGILFSEGVLNINAFHEGEASGADATHGFNLGSGSRLYGTSVNFDAGDNAATLYGSITSTAGDITIKGGDISVIGSLTSSKKGKATQVEGVAKNGNTADSGVESITMDDLKDPDAKIPTVEKAYSHMANYDKDEATQAQMGTDGSIKIEASGSAEVLYGNMGEGKIDTQGDFTVKGKDSVYVDSDLHIGGDLNLNSDGEIVLDLSNMGNIGTTPEEKKDHLHENFLDHFKNGGTEGKGTIKVGGVENAVNADNFMIAIDMWDYQNNEFDLDKYDRDTNDTLAGDIDKLKINIGGNDKVTARDHTFIWVDGAEQLAGIQKYKNDKDKLGEKTNILSYNFALKDNIDASSIEDYEGIASNVDGDGKPTEAFTGTFDGRDFAIIGLDVNRVIDDDGNETTNDVANAGIFGTIGTGGTVKDLNVYSSKFTGGDTAGAIAGRNEGEITGITTLGNRVEVTGEGATTKVIRGESAGKDAGTSVTVGAAGGIVGVNFGIVDKVNVSDTVIASENGKTTADMTVAGGIAGINSGAGAFIGDLYGMVNGEYTVSSTSAVLTNVHASSPAQKMHGLGGITGINEGFIVGATAYGATNGSYGAFASTSNEYVGGITGVNYTYIFNAYNESAVIGASNVGGIVGKNDNRYGIVSGAIVGEARNVVNTGSVTAVTGSAAGNNKAENVGGIVGDNYGDIRYGRNTGTVSGESNVGGIVGHNAEDGRVMSISNAIAAEISGENYVGGIVGTNAGEITGDMNLVNEGKVKGNQYVGGVAGVNEKTGVIRGGEDESGSKRTTNLATITGNTYVGGIAGVNKGEIANTNSDVTFAFDADASVQYVGGVAGRNEGKITNATNASDIIATNATFVGGITGENAENAVLENAGNSGNVSGDSMVGGVAGVNHASHDGGTIINSGTVTAKNGGAAGIFYENHAGLSNVTLINSGQVNGGGNTGGVIGVNSGTISGSTLANTGYVKANSGENVGGLIGHNTSKGSVIGGRNEADTMYVHKIYNNGRVSGGTNVGGLIGHNEGTLTAGYNTGNVNGQQNVGGIAGTNNGSISEVFNTVMTGDAEATGSISGANNVGGLVGYNKGTLTDAYNTTAVNGGGVKGNAVGTNDGAVKNVYAWNTNGKLIGSASSSSTKENTYSFVSGDSSANFVIPALGQMESESYEGFDFGSTWKNYDGWSLPMLKVFLTKGEVSQNGVTAADGLAAFNNANSLIIFVPDPETGGMYMTVFSAQIAGSFGPDGVFNPNNLGYDLEGVYVRGNNNGFLHSDGWDRIKNFRERKAELYFHNGGMEYAEEL